MGDLQVSQDLPGANLTKKNTPNQCHDLSIAFLKPWKNSRKISTPQILSSLKLPLEGNPSFLIMSLRVVEDPRFSETPDPTPTSLASVGRIARAVVATSFPRNGEKLSKKDFSGKKDRYLVVWFNSVFNLWCLSYVHGIKIEGSRMKTFEVAKRVFCKPRQSTSDFSCRFFQPKMAVDIWKSKIWRLPYLSGASVMLFFKWTLGFVASKQKSSIGRLSKLRRSSKYPFSHNHGSEKRVPTIVVGYLSNLYTYMYI